MKKRFNKTNKINKENGDSSIIHNPHINNIPNHLKFNNKRDQMLIMKLIIVSLFLIKINCNVLAAYQFYGLSSLPNPIPNSYTSPFFPQPDLTL